MTGRFFDQDRIKNDQNSDKNKGCFLSSKSLRPFYRATHLVSPSRIGQTGEYSKFKFTKPRSATRWATLYIKKCVLSPAGGSHLLNFVPYLYLTSICRFFLIKYILIQRAHKAPMKEIKTSSDLFQVEMTLMSQVHLLRTSISTLLNESPKI